MLYEVFKRMDLIKEKILQDEDIVLYQVFERMDLVNL